MPESTDLVSDQLAAWHGVYDMALRQSRAAHDAAIAAAGKDYALRYYHERAVWEAVADFALVSIKTTASFASEGRAVALQRSALAVPLRPKGGTP